MAFRCRLFSLRLRSVGRELNIGLLLQAVATSERRMRLGGTAAPLSVASTTGTVSHNWLSGADPTRETAPRLLRAKVLEHQAVRKMEGRQLSAGEVERLGLALAKLTDRMGDLKGVFGLSEEDLPIDLGPLGRVR